MRAPIDTYHPGAIALASAIAAVAIARHVGVYGSGATDWRRLARRRTSTAVAVAAGFFLVTVYLTEVPHNRAWLPLGASALYLAIMGRISLTQFLAKHPKARPLVANRVVLLGSEDSIAQFDALERKEPHQQIVERINLDINGGVRAAMRKADKVVTMSTSGAVDRVVVLSAGPGMPVVNAFVRRCGMNGVGVDLLTGATRIRSSRIEMGRMHGFSTIHVRPGLHGPLRRGTKRVFDMVVAAVLLVVLAPVFAVAAIAVKSDSAGPVFYRQRRLGRSGRQFEMIKFRSMVVNADQMVIDLSDENEADGPLFKMKNDPRVTRVGRMIRRTSIDELPQIWNVLRGQMSLVGPRPALAHEADGWPAELFDRLVVAPGITGLWQVTGRSDATFADYERLDLYYVDNWTMGLDIRILLRTIPALLGRGAY